MPLTALVGGIGTAVVWSWSWPTHVDGRIVGFTWMGLGIVMYVVYRKRKGYSLTQTVKAVPLPESVQADIDYNQLLVPIVGSRITDEMMVLACQLATEKQSSVDALYVIEVPFNLPLDARLPQERETAKALLEQAAVVADQFGVEMTPIVVTARAAGRAIVDEAKERRSEVIILGATRKRRFTERAFGRHDRLRAPARALRGAGQPGAARGRLRRGRRQWARARNRRRRSRRDRRWRDRRRCDRRWWGRPCASASHRAPRLS